MSIHYLIASGTASQTDTVLFWTGVSFAAISLGFCIYVFLTMKELSPDRREMMRFFISITAGFSAFLISGDMNIEGEYWGFTISASGGMALALIFYRGYGELIGTKAKNGILLKNALLAQKIHRAKEIADKNLKILDPSFSDEVHQLCQIIAGLAAEEDSDALQLIDKLDAQNDIGALINFLEDDSKLNNNVHLKNLALFDLYLEHGDINKASVIADGFDSGDQKDIQIIIRLAMLAERKGNLMQAEDFIRKAEQIITTRTDDDVDYAAVNTIYQFIAHLSDNSDEKNKYEKKALRAAFLSGNIDEYISLLESYGQIKLAEKYYLYRNSSSLSPQAAITNGRKAEEQKDTELAIIAYLYASGRNNDGATDSAYRSLADLYLSINEYKLALRYAHRIVEYNSEHNCAFGVRAGYLTLYEVEKKFGEIHKANHWLEKAKEISESIGDDSIKKAFGKHGYQVAVLKQYGIIGDDNEVNKEMADILLNLMNRYNIQEVFERLKIIIFRNSIILPTMNGEDVAEFPMTKRDAETLYDKLGFDESPYSVNIDEARKFFKKFSLFNDKYSAAEFIGALDLRKATIENIEENKDAFSLWLFEDAGFNKGDLLDLNMEKYRRTLLNIQRMARGDKQVEHIQKWIQLYSIIHSENDSGKEDNTLSKEKAQYVFKELGFTDDPGNISRKKYDEALQEG